MTDRGRPATKRTYLDDPDLPRIIDPADVGADLDEVLTELSKREPNPDDVALIVQGAAMLHAAGAGTAAECLATSMTWLHG